MSNETEWEAYHKWKAEAEPYGFNGFAAFQAGAEWQRSQSAPAGLIERDTLRKQLDEANSAYARLADGVPAAMAKYHKCKKQLDEARKQLDEARELLVEPQRFPSSKWADKWQVQRDAWLEKTK